MGDFRRRFDRIDALKQLASSPEPNWWKDLLSLWGPSGTGRAERPLRLAIRDNAINFYLRGQAIADIRCDRRGEPFSKIHVKYVFPGAKEQHRAVVSGSNVVDAKYGREAMYNSPHSVRDWMARAAGWETPEKAHVERVCADNAGVIEVEMGLPAYGDRKTPLRIDLVALEGSAEAPRLVFWEAKRISDQRIKSRSDEPEVLNQIANYRKFLNDPASQKQVEQAYANSCELLVKFAAMAGKGVRLGLDERVIAVASGESSLSVDTTPRLLVLGSGSELESKRWLAHRSKLEGLGIQMQVVRTDAYKLDRPREAAPIQ